MLRSQQIVKDTHNFSDRTLNLTRTVKRSHFSIKPYCKSDHTSQPSLTLQANDLRRASFAQATLSKFSLQVLW
ncbi:hypothetical protein [Calothrix sp. PCC 7507]|uniref:hypothetical protein n=1 Tax=Calothrix sp. PCC 7507 TaxID=99598 RepID=UPI0002E0A078|nr:hypothetical protein [Calothrix sp. PCC 7507]